MEPGAKVDGLCDGRTLEIWGAIDGQAEVNDVALEAVRFALLPATMGAYEIRTTAGATLLRTYVPAPPAQ